MKGHIKTAEIIANDLHLINHQNKVSESVHVHILKK